MSDAPRRGTPRRREAVVGAPAYSTIVVFGGPPRVVGQLVRAEVVDATAFTLFGEVVTGERVGVEPEPAACPAGGPDESPGPGPLRIELPLL